MARDDFDRNDHQQPIIVKQPQSSGIGMGILAILVALVFIVGPFVAPLKISSMSQVILVGFGVMLLLIGSIIVVITRLYRKTAADEAFVRTGMGGQKPIIDGGAIVISAVHRVIPVSLKTMKLIVERTGPDALITGDSLRADVRAEFFIKVQKNATDVLAAATSLGEIAINPKAVEATVYEKLVNALRTASATKDLADLNSKRDEFATAVQQIVEKDLKHNGLTLESVTISKLDQTDPKSLRPEENVFDAEGAKKITKITQGSRVERNRLEKEAEQQITTQNVTTSKFVFEQDIDRETAKAKRDRDVTMAQAEAQQEAASKAAEQQRIAEMAQVAKDKAVQTAQVEANQVVQLANVAKDRQTQLATVERDKNVKVAQVEAERARQTAEIEQKKAVELAERQKQIAVAAAEKERADAEALRLAAEKAREIEAQAVMTVEAVQTAERQKQQAVIAKQADAEQTRIEKQVEADVAAYGKIKEAEAEQIAAEAKATARLRLAEADQQAKAMEAQGDQAVQMVPVNVAKEGVEVERKKVEVQKDLLEAQSAHQEIVRALQVELARIAAQKEVGIKMAESVGVAFSKANMTIYGDPATVARMTQAFFQGQAFGEVIEGAATTAPDKVQDAALKAADNLTGGLGALAAGLIKNLTGKDVDPTVVERHISEIVAGA